MALRIGNVAGLCNAWQVQINENRCRNPLSGGPAFSFVADHVVVRVSGFSDYPLLPLCGFMSSGLMFLYGRVVPISGTHLATGSSCFAFRIEPCGYLS